MAFKPRRPIPLESKRIALDRQIALKFSDFEGFVSEYSTNISMTGMFVRSDNPQPAGTPVSLEFQLQDGVQLVRGKGWVVWSRPHDQSKDRPSGMGIEFLELGQESRRLIRWLIQNEMPEGSAPYDVHAAAKRENEYTERERKVGSSLMSGFLAGFAGFLVVIALIAWLLDRAERARGRRDRVASVAVGSTAGSSDAEHEENGMLEARSESAVAGRGIGPAVLDSQVRETVLAWAEAWSRQDVDSYLSFYSDDFLPEDDLDLETWRGRRRNRIRGPGQIRIAVTRFESLVATPDRALVRFHQTYRSDAFADTVIKTLKLVRLAGGWKIERESSTPV